MQDRYVPLIGDDSVASLLSIGVTVARELAKREDFPIPVKVSAGCKRWKVSEVISWADAQRGTQTQQK